MRIPRTSFKHSNRKQVEGRCRVLSPFLSSAILLASILAGSSQPTITSQPANQTASLFADVTFRVAATGDTPLSYQWHFKNADLTGMTNATLTITNVQNSNVGGYNVTVTNLSGSATSQVASLTITLFNSLYCFGFSWTDTGGGNCGWPAPQYYNDSACNGPMWPQFLSSNLGLAYAQSNNYAFCGATSSDVLNQVNSLKAPARPGLSLYCLWSCDSEFLSALPPDGKGYGYLNLNNQAAWSRVILTAISRNSNAINNLYLRGAREILVQKIFDYSQLPASISALGNNAAALSTYRGYCAQFNASLKDLIEGFHRSKADLRIVYVDIFSKLTDVIAHPNGYGFTKTNVDALDDTMLTDKSFVGPGADYVFWDGFHPTSKLQELIAAWHLETLANSVLEDLRFTMANGSMDIQMNHLRIGRDYTLQASSGLNRWQDVQTFTAAAGTNHWTSNQSGIAGTTSV
jgi:phospholipase/lecithinase/hemolysin